MIKSDYRTMPLDKLALELSSQHHPDSKHILQQVEGWQRLRSKVPTWTGIDGIEFPPRLALEQCSGEVAARYKSCVVKRLLPKGATAMVDLTGGLGVDFSFIAPWFKQAVYVERQAELCRLATHNFPLLGLTDAQIVNADGVDYLRQMEQPVDLIFIDPARRSETGRKVVFIEDCEPNVCELCSLLTEKAKYVVVKFSTMLDVTASVRSLGCVKEVHVVASGGECKDLLLVLKKGVDNAQEQPTYYVSEGECSVQFDAEEEQHAMVTYAQSLGKYLYEPGAAVMKAGAFKLMSQRYAIDKLHVNTHLYTSSKLTECFPGRTFEVVQCLGFNKKDLKQLAVYGNKANLTIRNFPSSVASLRKKLKLKEGGSIFLFATTIADNQHVLIVCKKII